MSVINFERIYYGHDREKKKMQGTKIGWTLIPDYEFLYLDEDELIKKYGWKKYILAKVIKTKVNMPGNYILNTTRKKIIKVPA